jgi:hypothetical protein
MRVWSTFQREQEEQETGSYAKKFVVVILLLPPVPIWLTGRLRKYTFGLKYLNDQIKK